MNWLTFTVYSVWLLSEVMLNRLMRSKKQDQPNKDKNSLAIIWITIVIAITVAVYVSQNSNYRIFDSLWMEYAGLGLIFSGVILRLIIVRSLGIFFTADVTIKENHSLKKDGVYRYLRHPSYLASLISFIGFGLSLNNWGSLIIVVIAIFIAFLYRIKVEEKALLEHFGQEYANYQKTTRAIIPFIY